VCGVLPNKRLHLTEGALFKSDWRSSKIKTVVSYRINSSAVYPCGEVEVSSAAGETRPLGCRPSHIRYGVEMHQQVSKVLCLLAPLLCANFAAASNCTQASGDSLVDVFPLAVGNQWVYRYDYQYSDVNAVIDSYADTGTVTLDVVDCSRFLDSTNWVIRERGVHWTQTNNLAWSGPTVQVDSFEIVEFNSGRHQLYRTGDPWEVQTSVIPFSSNLVDTAKVCRYAVVDSSGLLELRSYEMPAVPIHLFVFKRDTGLLSVATITGISGWPYWESHHTLRSSIVTEIAEHRPMGLPAQFVLNQNYPNPFNPTTTFSFKLPRRAQVSLRVFDLLGRLVDTVMSEILDQGSHSRRWDAQNMASGVYVYQLRVEEQTLSKRLVLLK